VINIKIMPNDTSTVAKVVIIDNKDRVLMLKRSEYTKKFAGEWDLPGGHLKPNEALEAGLSREVKEETSLTVSMPAFVLQMDNIHFFMAAYDSQPVNLSHEHTDYRFFEKEELDPSQKFQKVALEAIEKQNA